MTSSRRGSARERLVRIVQDLERLEEAKRDAMEALQQAFTSAKWAGFDTRTLKAVLRLRKLSPEQRKEQRALEAIYLASLGMLEGDPLPDEARRRLDEAQSPPPPPPDSAEPAKKGSQETKAQLRDAPPAPAPPAQKAIPLKDPEEARKEGREAAAAGKRIYDNPFPAGDPCRAAWDEGWCEKKKSHGMDTPTAYQRRGGGPAKDQGGPEKEPS